MMTYIITDKSLQIRESYRYGKKDMIPSLRLIHANYPHSDIWRRNMRSLRAEWMVHNACYRLHILRSHTADVDLNYPNRAAWLYRLLTPLASLIIK